VRAFYKRRLAKSSETTIITHQKKSLCRLGNRPLRTARKAWHKARKAWHKKAWHKKAWHKKAWHK